MISQYIKVETTRVRTLDRSCSLSSSTTADHPAMSALVRWLIVITVKLPCWMFMVGNRSAKSAHTEKGVYSVVINSLQSIIKKLNCRIKIIYVLAW